MLTVGMGDKKDPPRKISKNKNCNLTQTYSTPLSSKSPNYSTLHHKKVLKPLGPSPHPWIFNTCASVRENERKKDDLKKTCLLNAEKP